MRLTWIIFHLYALVWTAALITPGSVEAPFDLGEFILSRRMLVAKTLHVVGYALFAILGGSLQLGWRGRLILLFLLMFHGAATEFIQQYVERGASVNDVVLDHAALALGIALSWKWWTKPPLAD